MPPSIHTFRLKKPSRKLCLLPLPSASSAARSAASCALSSADSHLACWKLFGNAQNVRIPSSTLGIASSRNSHCQPCRPCTWSKWPMIQPEIGPPITLDSGSPIMNSAMMRPRR
ncbi:hypothetical protein D3C76_1263430 [compost metagenome]